MKYLEKIIEYGLYLFVFLLPWQTRWIWHWGELNGGVWEYGTFSLYATDIVLVMILLLTLILSLRGSEAIEAIPVRKLRITHYALPIALLIISALTIFWSADKSLALYAWFKLLEGIILFWLVINIRFSYAKLAWAFVGAAVIQSLLGIWQFLTQSTFASKWLGMAYYHAGQLGSFVIETSDGRWLRAYGSLPHPNILAGFLVAAIFILVGLWLREDSPSLSLRGALATKQSPGLLHPDHVGVRNDQMKKLLFAACYLLLITCLFFTFSRSAWLAFIVVSLLYCYIVWISSRPVKLRNGTGKAASSDAPLRALLQLLAMSTILIALLAAIYWPLVSTRLRSAERLEIKSTQERTVGYQESWQLVKNNWYKGVGIGNYTLAVHKQINSNLPAWSYQPVHNIYILILAELGVVGFLIFAVFLLCEISTKKNCLLVYSLALPALLIIGLFDHYLWTLHFGILLFWLVLGLEVFKKATNN